MAAIPSRDPRWKFASPKLYVELSAAPNPDYEPDEPQGSVSIKPKKYPVKDLAHASKVCQDFIRKNDLGGGNWTGGQVTDERGRPVAQVSYNGRVWDASKPGGKEIKLSAQQNEPHRKFADDDPVARQIREKLSDMSRDLGRFGEHAAKREGETTADPQLGKAWEKAAASLRAAEAAVDRARHDLYPLG